MLKKKKVTVANTLDLNPVVDGSMGFCSENLKTTVGQFHLYSGEPAVLRSVHLKMRISKMYKLTKRFRYQLKYSIQVGELVLKSKVSLLSFTTFKLYQ